MGCFSLFLNILASTFGTPLQYMSYLYVCIGVYLKHAFFSPIFLGFYAA
jgi:hypothetical protein